MEIVILIVVGLLMLAFVGKSLEIIQKLIEFFKRDDIRNLTIGGGVIAVGIGIFFGNIAFFITLILFIGMLCSEWMKSPSSSSNEISSKPGFMSSVSDTFHKFKSDVNTNREERKSKSREIQKRKAARYEASKPSNTKPSSTGSFNKEVKEKPMKQKYVVMFKMGKTDASWVKNPKLFDDIRQAQNWASHKQKAGYETQVMPA
tara:strand:+ start:43 stop:651 length:609 start_codon:yes stop_codon:yes gene_type:complete